ncbi:NUDIX domain-containing protein [Paenarthrobacter ureafaciens]
MTEQPAKDTPVAEARLAASVILLRDASAGLEAFVQHRVSSMDFAAGMVVFPGGRVDASDAEGWDYSSELLERHAADWAMSSIAASDPHAQAGTVLAAAIREVFEEAGLTLDASQLRPWANWVTPTDMPKRFDTYFYVAKARPRSRTAAPNHGGMAVTLDAGGRHPGGRGRGQASAHAPNVLPAQGDLGVPQRGGRVAGRASGAARPVTSGLHGCVPEGTREQAVNAPPPP